MKFTLLFLLALSCAFAQVPVVVPQYPAIANLPSSASAPPVTVGQLGYVIDGANMSDCTVGGGSSRLTCQFNGFGWVAVSSATPLVQQFIAGTGGVAANTLVRWDTPGTVVALTGAEGVLGIALSAQTAGGPVSVAIIGPARCVAEGSVTAGHYVISGTVAPTKCKDSGQTALGSIPITTRIVGKATATVSDTAIFTVELIGAYKFGAQITGTGVSAGSAGQVQASDGSGGFAADSGLAYNSTSKSLGVIGTIVTGQPGTGTGQISFNAVTSGTTILVPSDAVSPTLMLPTTTGTLTSSSGGSNGHATCWKNTLLSYCESVVGSDGTCTCH